ncbi:MBL fold metallo-hydrolase [Candidatus Saccharibacteria bacterium]|nr:MBL fold metallo-hydrolase [Candidatus Saccharibacteria bacterium]
MKVTKYEHACLVVEENGERLVIDPGMLAKLPELENVVAVVVTHVHPDHLHLPNLQALVGASPGLTIFGSDEVIAELGELDVKKVSVENDMMTVGRFRLEFFGHDHAVIYQQVPCQNRGVLVNETLYYPGDSFTLPEKPVQDLAFPAAGPWCKVSEVADFITAVKPQRAFPTHDATLSEFGASVNYRYIQQAIEAGGGEFVQLKPGESLADA